MKCQPKKIIQQKRVLSATSAQKSAYKKKPGRKKALRGAKLKKARDLLSSGKSIRETAGILGVSRDTIWRVANQNYTKKEQESPKQRQVVVKFGGKSLASCELLLKAAKSVKEEIGRGSRVVVVVSAVGDFTDIITQYCNGIGICQKEKDPILSYGERISAGLFCASLGRLGIRTRVLDPSEEDWPIQTDSKFGEAKIKEKSITFLRRKLSNLSRDTIPIVPGFIGKSEKGEITTLGRGTSDLTAFLVAKAIHADEVIKVTDVEGVTDLDGRVKPKINLEQFKKIQERSWVIHPKSLDFIDPHTKIKVVSFIHGCLDVPGTLIGGINEDAR